MSRQGSLKPITIRLDADMLAAMDRLFARDGINTTETIRRALTAFLTTKGVMTDTRANARTSRGGGSRTRAGLLAKR